MPPGEYDPLSPAHSAYISTDGYQNQVTESVKERMIELWPEAASTHIMDLKGYFGNFVVMLEAGASDPVWRNVYIFSQAAAAPSNIQAQTIALALLAEDHCPASMRKKEPAISFRTPPIHWAEAPPPRPEREPIPYGEIQQLNNYLCSLIGERQLFEASVCGSCAMHGVRFDPVSIKVRCMVCGSELPGEPVNELVRAQHLLRYIQVATTKMAGAGVEPG